jgi:hypothetical protein
LNGGPQRVTASFETADDLLWQAVAGRLPKLGPITLVRSGRIGPLVELAMATAAHPDAYCGVTVEPPVRAATGVDGRATQHQSFRGLDL